MFNIETSRFQNASEGTFHIAMSPDGKGLVLNYLAVPEPSSTILTFSGICLLLRRPRRHSV